MLTATRSVCNGDRRRRTNTATVLTASNRFAREGELLPPPRQPPAAAAMRRHRCHRSRVWPPRAAGQAPPLMLLPALIMSMLMVMMMTTPTPTEASLLPIAETATTISSDELKLNFTTDANVLPTDTAKTVTPVEAVELQTIVVNTPRTGLSDSAASTTPIPPNGSDGSSTSPATPIPSGLGSSSTSPAVTDKTGSDDSLTGTTTAVNIQPIPVAAPTTTDEENEILGGADWRHKENASDFVVAKPKLEFSDDALAGDLEETNTSQVKAETEFERELDGPPSAPEFLEAHRLTPEVPEQIDEDITANKSKELVHDEEEVPTPSSSTTETPPPTSSNASPLASSEEVIVPIVKLQETENENENVREARFLTAETQNEIEADSEAVQQPPGEPVEQHEEEHSLNSIAVDGDESITSKAEVIVTSDKAVTQELSPALAASSALPASSTSESVEASDSAAETEKAAATLSEQSNNIDSSMPALIAGQGEVVVKAQDDTQSEHVSNNEQEEEQEEEEKDEEKKEEVKKEEEKKEEEETDNKTIQTPKEEANLSISFEEPLTASVEQETNQEEEQALPEESEVQPEESEPIPEESEALPAESEALPEESEPLAEESDPQSAIEEVEITTILADPVEELEELAKEEEKQAEEAELPLIGHTVIKKQGVNLNEEAAAESIDEMVEDEKEKNNDQEEHVTHRTIIEQDPITIAEESIQAVTNVHEVATPIDEPTKQAVEALATTTTAPVTVIADAVGDSESQADESETTVAPQIATTEASNEATVSSKGSRSINTPPLVHPDAAVQPHDAGQTLSVDHLAAESAAGPVGKALPTLGGDRHKLTTRSVAIIVVCSSTALLFVVISVTMFLISFQRQHGTLDIEMQERRCGKEILRETGRTEDGEDVDTRQQLLEIELPIVEVVPQETDECL